jgi:DNA polymerase-3 subunit beta
MNLTVNSQVLAQELRLLSKIAPEKPAIAILSNILLQAEDELHLTATNLEVGLHTECPASVTQSGAVTLPAKKMLDLLEQLPDADVKIIQDRSHVYVTCGAFKSRIQTLPADDFPVLPTVDGQVTTLSATTLRSLIDRTVYAIADRANKYTLDGSLLSLVDGVMAMVATDGKRLSLATSARPSGSTGSLIIPSKTLEILTAFLTDEDVEFSQTDRHLFFQVGHRVLFSRMLDGKFPNYEGIIPRANTNIATVERAPLMAALKRVLLMSEDNKAINFSFAQGIVTLTSSSAVIGEADEPVAMRYVGDDLKVCANGSYVLDFLTAAVEQTVTIALKDPSSAMLLTDGNEFINVVMLMRS